MGTHVIAPHNATYSNPTTQTFKPATEKQVAFLTSLLNDRVMDDEHRHWLLLNIEKNVLSSLQASQEIDGLLSKPKIKKDHPVRTKAEYVASEEGYFMDSQKRFFEVVKSKRGHTYAMGLVPHGSKFKWVYVPGAMKNFQQWVKVTEAEATEFGKRYGICMICARALTNPDSVERGIGPICLGKFG